MSANANGPTAPTADPSHTTPSPGSHMVEFTTGLFTTEDVTAKLRSRTAPILAAHLRLIEVENAAKRIWQAAFTARAAHTAGSMDEACALLRSIDHAADELTDRHVQHALIAIDTERAA